MPAGEFLTRATVWLALGGYFVGISGMLMASANVTLTQVARAAWNAGCGFFLAHIVSAFSFYHGWSHAAAYNATARQTAETVGLAWGGGLFFNYLFAILWVIDVLGWMPATGRRSQAAAVLWHSFAFFMVVNATVVFGHGAVRWFGGIGCIALALLWGRRLHKQGAKRPH